MSTREVPTSASRSCECGWWTRVSGPNAEARADQELANHTCR
ncbi:hypothetical protein F4561_002167 [Lipingzhangella halophila]|uniref:Uncharacterized protein n=1 Tax=Lipingzhangella halophila TaxID=1783352 RepID=A0A7W7W1U3_9ACTN|nr:hypothetical protein [Lipingzhangella halophila]MBB4931347.1 hypothetical protein [Lipingzhangella halophila]